MEFTTFINKLTLKNKNIKMITKTLNEKGCYTEVSITENNVTASTRIYDEDVDKYRRGEMKNDPMIMAESVVKQALKDQIERNRQ